MNPTSLVSPWGSPPTPVLPGWYIEELSSRPLPEVLRQGSSSGIELEVVGDLTQFWHARSRSLNSEEHDALVSLVGQTMASGGTEPPQELIIVPAHADIMRLLGCPLRRRTRNCLRRALNSNMLQEGKPVTVGQLVALPGFGIRSLLDLMCVVEAAEDVGAFLPSTTDDSPPSASLSEAETKTAMASDALSAQWSPAIPVLVRLFAASEELDGARTLTDVLNSSVGELVAALGMTDYLDEVKVSEPADGLSLAEEVVADLAALRASLTPLEQAILEKRILTSRPLTLEELGQAANLTRERIRQIEKSVESRLHHPSASGAAVLCWIAVLGVLLRNQLGPITNRDALEGCISATFHLAENNSDDERAVADMARHLLRENSGYSPTAGFCLSQTASDTIAELKKAAQDLADEVGLIDESNLMDRLPDDSLEHHWDQLIALCGLHRLCGHLALRDTAKAKAKAAVLSLGRPATKEEIGELCGLASNRLGAQLSAIPGVIRADKKRWGLSEWIDDEYEGIPAEIIQRIEEDGGATRLERLLEELPRMFDVTERSVEAYAKSARFRISDGYVSVADPSAITLRALEDVIHGRTDNGLPFWSFKVEDRYFDGYSLAGLPPEIAKSLGCEPDGNLRVQLMAPEGCEPVSVRWPLTSLTGATLGYLAEPLRLLGACQDERIHLVLESSRSVSLRRPSSAHSRADQPDDSDDSSERARELLERMKERRRGF